MEFQHLFSSAVAPPSCAVSRQNVERREDDDIVDIKDCTNENHGPPSFNNEKE